MKSEKLKQSRRSGAADVPASTAGQALRINLTNILFLLVGMGLMALIVSLTSSPRAKTPGPQPAAPAPTPSALQQPWGELEYVDFSLREPEDYIPDSREQLPAARWVFEKFTADQLTTLFNDVEASEETRERLLDKAHWQVMADGVVVSPSRELLRDLGRPARQRIYPILGESRFNFSQFHPFRFRGGGFNAWFANSSLPVESLEVIRGLTYTNRNGALCLVDIDLLQERLTPAEFRKLQVSLYSEPTVLLSLRLRPSSDVNSLAEYWGSGGRKHELLPILKSLVEVPGGGIISVTHLLPPFARLRLYTFNNNTNAPVNEQDCFWTAVNFFQREPDPRLTNGMTAHDILMADYAPCHEAPRLGDVFVLLENNHAVHACVFIADGVVFTKNGANYRQPWVLMKMSDLIARYSSDQPLSIAVLRPKRSNS